MGVLCLLSLLIGCGYLRRVPHPPISEGVSLPGEEVASPQWILESLRERRASFQDLRALARVSITSQRGNYHVQQVVILRKDLSLRLETLGPIGQPSLYLLVQRDHLTLYSPYEGIFLQGKAISANIFKLTGLPLTVAEVVDLLSGSVPSFPDSSRSTLAYQAEAGLYWLQVFWAGGRPYQRAWVGSDDLAPRGYQLYDSGGEVYLVAEYTHYTPLEGTFFPYKVRVHLPREKAYIELTYQEVSLNQGVPSSLFQLAIPPNVDIIELP